VCECDGIDVWDSPNESGEITCSNKQWNTPWMPQSWHLNLKATVYIWLYNKSQWWMSFEGLIGGIWTKSGAVMVFY